MRVLFPSWLEVPSRDWTWPFSPKDVACRGTGELLINKTALNKLADLIFLISFKITILSAYRSSLHNAHVGGAPLSRHKFGDAFDLAASVQQQETIIQAARQLGFSGFGRYNTFVHIDCGRKREWRG